MQKEEAQRVFTQIMRTRCYCFKKGLVHGDLKWESILVDAEGNTKLCNFYPANRCTAWQKLDMICTTLWSCPSELYWWEGYDVLRVDIWSLTGCLPFNGATFFAAEGADPPYKVQHSCWHFYQRAKCHRRLLNVDPHHTEEVRGRVDHGTLWLSQGEEH